MANKSLFRSIVGLLMPKTDTVNSAGGAAYRLDPKQALAQYATTGCLNSTFYASAETQLARVLELCAQNDPSFVARTAVYSRTQGHMKDLPALLCAVLTLRDSALVAKVFARVIDKPKMLRNFVQILRSGAVGRKSLGSAPKRLVLEWLAARSDEQLFRDSIGNTPSLADIVKMVHPKPATATRAALYAYLLGRAADAEQLPSLVKSYETYKRAADRTSLAVPDVPFQMLTALQLGAREWKIIAQRAPWQMTRMNLNTFARHGVFEDSELVASIAARLRDRTQIANAQVFPYQLLAAFRNTGANIPAEIRAALQDAMEIAIENVPAIAGKVYVFPDVSGSMRSPVTGIRRGATSAVQCVDIAALVAAAVLRKNPHAEVIPFSTEAIAIELNPRDSVMTNAAKLSALPAGGTNCSAPLVELNRRGATGDLLIYVSDNESWVDSPAYGRCGGSATATLAAWAAFKQRNPAARMVCIDIQANETTQARERADIVNVGGFGDSVFDLLAADAASGADPSLWVRKIEAVPL